MSSLTLYELAVLASILVGLACAVSCIAIPVALGVRGLYRRWATRAEVIPPEVWNEFSPGCFMTRKERL